MDLLVQKVQQIISSNVTSTELDNISSLYLSSDKVSIQTINVNNFKIDNSTTSIKKYWETNKENYMSQESYKVAFIKVKIGDNKKTTKKEALKKYLKLKKDELKFDETVTLSQNSDMFTFDNLSKIAISNTAGTIMKPFEDNGYYVVVKMIEKYAHLLHYHLIKHLP